MYRSLKYLLLVLEILLLTWFAAAEQGMWMPHQIKHLDLNSIGLKIPEVKIYNARDFGKYKDKNLDDIAVCFLTVIDATGGSSGSPVLDANGEIVKLLFDGVYESVVGDYFVVPKFQREINVDIRYVLFVTEKFSGAHHLLKEMGL